MPPGARCPAPVKCWSADFTPSQIDCDAKCEFSRGTRVRTIPEAIQKHTVNRLLEL
jgi:hypothetical protein